MNIAELVLNLGVKGSDKTAGALGTMQKGLKDTSSMAIETKVAIAGAVYALERLFAASGQVGTDLQNFNTLTGISAQTLQQYQFAARQVGAANEEVTATFKGLQSAMAEIQIGGAPPAGIAAVANTLGIEIGEKEVEEFKVDPSKLIQVLQQFAAKAPDKAFARKMLGTFPGMTDNMITALMSGVFNQQNLDKAPKYDAKQVSNLNKNNIKVQNLKNEVEMEIGKIYAAHGGEIIEDISRIMHEIIELGKAFGDLAEKAGLFTKLLPMVIEGWTQLIQVMSTLVEKFSKKGVIDTFKDWAFGSKEEQEAYGKQKAQEKALKEKIKANAAKGIQPPKGYTPEGDLESDTLFYVKMKPSPVAANTPPSPAEAKPAESPATPKRQAAKVIPITSATKVAAPTVLPVVQNNANSTEVTVNQNLNFQHDGSKAPDISKAHNKAANDAYRQMPQGQVK